MKTRTERANKVASVVSNLELDREVTVGDACEARAGNVVLVKALEEKRVYDQLELCGGRMAKISKGDLIVGALGSRRALKGFVGHVPESLAVGDKLHMLNIGGVIGLASSGHLDLGKPLAVECLGMVVDPETERILNIADKALPLTEVFPKSIPLVMVSGTSMSSGKTEVCCELIQQLTHRGRKVLGAKVSGVACLKDAYRMIDHGALDARTFLDCGLPSTVGAENLDRVTRTLIAMLVQESPEAELIVIELGDGIVGGYGLSAIFDDRELMAATRVHIMCATDLVGIWGAVSLMAAKGIRPDIMSGPATDNEVGNQYVTDSLHLFAANAKIDAVRLADRVEELLAQRAGTGAR